MMFYLDSVPVGCVYCPFGDSEHASVLYAGFE